jgi:hypothetical protein
VFFYFSDDEEPESYFVYSSLKCNFLIGKILNSLFELSAFLTCSYNLKKLSLCYPELLMSITYPTSLGFSIKS